MYGTKLHKILRKALLRAMWTRSTDNEDNFRHILCSAIYRFVSPDNVEIPSTRSSAGDIKIFGRNVELKYGSKGKKESLEAVLEDFETLLAGDSDFTVVSVRLERGSNFNYLHNIISLPMLKKVGANVSIFDSHYNNPTPGGLPLCYKGVSIFLGAVYPHAPAAIMAKASRGKNSTAYLSFENPCSISKSYFLQLPTCLVHVDVIGTREDGMISFLFKKADEISLVELPKTTFSVDIPYTPNPIVLAKGKYVEAYSPRKKFTSHALKGVAENLVEQNVPCFIIY